MRKLPPLASLRAFEAAARRLSFKEAAEELSVTPTAVSHQIRLLEKYSGQLLFRRRPRPLVLTPAGERLFPAIRDGLDAFVCALEGISRGAAKRPLRITAPNAFAGRWLVPRFREWREAHPDVRLELIGTDAVLDLRAGEADVAVRYARGAPSDPVVQEIFRDSYFPVCSPELLARTGRPIRCAADLLGYPLVHFDWFNGDPSAPLWPRWLATARSIDPGLPGATKSWDLSFRDEQHAIDAVLAGQGIGIFSDIVVSEELRSGTLVKAHELALSGYGFYLAHLPNHPLLPIIAAFSAWMRAAA
jgi:LysR family transcriptional regulator, glycine cleavage system transcriptional activator